MGSTRRICGIKSIKMSSVNATLLKSIFSDLISSEFDCEADKLRKIYDAKYDHRHAFGLTSTISDEQLEDEWRFKYIKLQKQRNWLWYLMKNEKFIELDGYFNTDYTFSDMDLRLRVEYDLFYKKEQERYKFNSKKSSFVHFSKSNLPVENCELNVEEEYDCNLYLPYIKEKRRARSYESLIDNNRVYNKCEIDDRDYDRLYSISKCLRFMIVFLETLRKKATSSRFFRRVSGKDRDLFENIELNDLKYQSGGLSTPLNIDKAPVEDLINEDNRPLCCPYCPSITCMNCFSGEGCCMCTHVVYQGGVEQDVGGDTNVVQTHVAHNVVLTETEISQNEQTSKSNIGWSKFVSSDVISQMDPLVNRWFEVGTYNWVTTMPVNTTIISIDLPRTAIFGDSTTCNQPNQIPFRIHRYWRGNMIVKVQVNCNKFQIGQLQCAWYYQPKADASFSTKANVYTRSGTHHCIISAAPNNEVTMVIPFKSYKSMYHTKSYNGDQLDLPLDLGTLFISVLSQLKAVGETSPKCNFTVFVKLEDNEFTGMIAGDVDEPRQLSDDSLHYQMDGVGSLLSAAVPIVENMLVGSRNDNNRDNPPMVNPPQFLVPTASHSWSVGTDVAEPLHNLRLSGVAQTPHPDVDLDEMKIDVLKRKYMLLNTFTWSQQDNNGKELWSIPVNPIPPKDRIYKVNSAGTNTLASYQLTPIGFISSLYQYWRGSIEYRFDIVASQFHSGKILLAYIPGIAEGQTVTLKQARASPNIVISLDNAMSYTWKVPYVSDRPWWPRRYAGESVTNNMSSPSKIFAFVLNELVLAETVPDTLEILVYMRGGEDMEFAIPVQPSIGLGYDRNYISSRNNTNVFPVSTTTTYYAGNWHSAPDVLVWRHASTSEAVGRFSEPILDRPVYYVLKSNYPVVNVISPGTHLEQVNHCIFLKGIGFSEYIGLPIFFRTGFPSDLDKLENIARAAFTNKYTYGPWVKEWYTSSDNPTGFIPSSYVTTSNTYGGGKAIPWTSTTVSVSLTLESLAYQGNRDESLALVDNTQFLRSTGRGFMTYGERFFDLKDLCRRFQIYGWTSVPKQQIERDPGACSFVFPVLPQGLNLAISQLSETNQIWNRAREGHIPLIASLYRFYRGSLRLRLVVTNGEGLTMWVQHRPDRRLYRDVIVPCTQVSTAEAVFNHSYGLYMQDMSVNHIVELEIPYYQMANFGLLQKPVINEGAPLSDWSHFYSLGELSVGFFGEQPSNDVRCTIYYSIADDCRFTTYQGVPPMVIIDDLPEYTSELRYQGLKSYFGFNAKEVGEEIADGATEKITENLESRVMPLLTTFMDDFQNKLSDTYINVKNSIAGSDYYSKLSNIASQIVHALNNPTPSTIAISVVSILIVLGIISYSIYNIVHKYVKQIWTWLSNKVNSKKVQEEVEVAQEVKEDLKYQSDSSDNAVVGFLSLVCGGLCSLFGMKNSIKYKPASDCLFKGITEGMKMSNVCFVFFKNLMSVIGDMKAMIVHHLYPGFNAAESLMQGRDIIEKWVGYSQDILDPMVLKNMPYDRELQLKLLDCYAFGKILKVKALETQYPAIIQLINTTFDKLHREHTNLVAQGLDPHVRKMPFVIYNYGAPEIGKSHLTTELCSELCKSQEITTETDLMCVLNATSKFWDNCDRQPCLVMDDAFNIRKGTMLEDQIAAIFNVVSPVVLVPPKAAVEDKGRMYNPELFILNSNHDFFKTDICIEEALWRRRDILIYTALDTDYVKEGCIHCKDKLKVNSTLPPEAILSLKDFHHLKFKYTFDVKNVNCEYQPVDRWLKYNEMLVILKETFAANRKAENIKFAHRVEQSNIVAGDRCSIVGNVENLESLWNDAIMRQKNAAELVKNSTFRTICTAFSQKVLNAWEEKKHGVLKKVYNIIKPGNNIYFNMNPLCSECNRIGYQCISCKLKLEECMKTKSQPPSAPPGYDASLLYDEKLGFVPEACTSTDPKFQSETALPPFQHDISSILSKKGAQDLANLSLTYPPESLSYFKKFLDDEMSELVIVLRRYPKYARSFSVLKGLCEKRCSCSHNCDTNMPIIKNRKFWFLNLQNPGNMDPLEDFTCNKPCWMCLPWMYYKTVKVCNSIDSTIVEGWMGDLVDKKINIDKLSFDKVFSKMTKYVFDFYYNIISPTAKFVFNLFTSFHGWLLSLSFLSVLFSTLIMGVSAYEVTTTPGLATGSVKDDITKVKMPKSSSATLNNNPSIDFQSNSYDSGKPHVSRAVRPKVKKPVKAEKDLKYQSSQQFSVVEDRVKNNMSSIIVVYNDAEGNVKRVQNFGLMLRDQQMLIQRHYYDFWKRLDISTQFYFLNNNMPKVCEFGIPVSDFMNLDVEWFSLGDEEGYDSNFGILHLPKTIPAFKNITKFIAKSVEHEAIKSDECYLYCSLQNRSLHCVINLEFNKSVTDSNGWMRLDQCYSYRYTGQGMCGSVLMCSGFERPIIGIHFAGTNTMGFAEPLCAESFVDLPVHNYDYECHEMLLSGKEPKIEFDTLLYPQGTMHPTYSHHQSSDSQYVPSLIQGVYKVDTEPNPLSPRDPRLPPGNPPLKCGVEHMGKPPVNFKKHDLEKACYDLKEVILKNVKPVRIKVDKVSLQDAICGNVNIKGFEPLEWSSSEGFPLKSMRPIGVKGKKWLFNLEETESGYVLKGMHGELSRQLSICYHLRKKGIRVPTIFTDCLKDTCIDIEKCKIPGKTRIFSISPVQYTIAFKQYFNDFLASYQNARLDAEHGIGINVDSLEWASVANYITRYSNNIVAGDYKNYGPSLMLSCVEKAFDIIMAWYQRYDPDEERQLIRRVLLSEILHAKHMCLNVVYGVPCGIPSGSPITTPLNSLVNSLYLRCAWLEITKKDFEIMHKNINILTYGDDVCVNVSEEYKDIYNTETLNKFFLNYNIIFTDIDKSDNIIKYRSLDNVTFLKRSFQLHPLSKFIFLAPIDEQSIRKCVNWITRKGDPIENTLENCKQACELAFGRGPEYYNSVKECLQHECIKRLNKTFSVPSWFVKSEACYSI